MPNDKNTFSFPDLNVPKSLTDSTLPSDANTAMKAEYLPADLTIKVYYGKTPGIYFAEVIGPSYASLPILAGSINALLLEIAGYCNNEAPSQP